MNNRPDCEIPPPWVEYPDYGCGDPFWRQSGELWYNYVWLPYWQSLDSGSQREYLNVWQVPYDWQHFCEAINPQFKQWLDEVDDIN